MALIVLIILGLCLGSFVNALVYRVHEQAKRPKSEKAKKRKSSELSIVHGRSICPNCRHVLSPLDLVPVLSWLWLRGKCRYCHKSIPDTPLAELLVPGLFILSYAFWPEPLAGFQLIAFGVWLIQLVGLSALLLYDAKWYLLPNRLVYPLLGLAMLQTALAIIFAPEGSGAVLGAAFWGLVVGGGLFWVLFQVSSGKWIGGGDVKLGALLGLLVGGPVASLLLIFIASLLGSVVGVPLMISGGLGKKHRLPFGPFLIIAAVIVRLFGAGIIDWYKRQAGL